MKKTVVKVEGVDTFNPNKYGGMVSREVALPMERKTIDFTKGIETIATTEAPAVVIDWERWEIVREILPMKFMEMPNNDKVPFLDSHQRGSLERVKGSAKNFRTQGSELLATVFISETEKALQDKIREGHVDSVSIGYMTSEDETIEVPKGKTVSINGMSFKNDFDDGMPLLVRTWWKVHELSGVAIGADEAAKFKSEGAEHKNLIQKISDLQKRVEDLEKNIPKETPEEKGTMDYIRYRLRMIEHENKN